jgi:tripartite-type tricarboxylate transporter receptor subunit TctC
VKAGRLRALAVTSQKRSPAAPELPTIAETYPGFDASPMNYLSVRGGTPKPVVAQLNAQIGAILAQPEVRSRITAAGLDPAGGRPEDFTALIKAEAARWAPLIRSLAIKLD